MRAALLLAALSVAPVALAQGTGERVDVAGAQFPPFVVPGRTFYINVSVHNRDAAPHDVLLFMRVYDGRGQACDEARAIDAPSRFHKGVALAPGQEVRVEGEREHWGQVLNASRYAAGVYEMCVWARLAQCPAGELAACLLDREPVFETVRLRNAPPTVRARAQPEEGPLPTRFAFTAQGSDADGDPLTYRWDFGDGEQAVGASVEHAYRGAGRFTARVNVTDGADFAEDRVTVVVREGGGGKGAPAPGVAALVLALMALARRR